MKCPVSLRILVGVAGLLVVSGTTPIAWGGLKTDFLLGFGYVGEGAALLDSETDPDADFAAGTADFTVFNPETLREVANALRDDASLNLVLINFIEDFDARAGEGTPFAAFAEVITFEDLEIVLQDYVNPDPFIAFEATFTNLGAEPLNIDVDLDLGILPMSVLAPSTLETFVSAELDANGNSEPTETDVFVFHTLSASDDPAAPGFGDTSNFNGIPANILVDLVPGEVATSSSGTVDFQPQAEAFPDRSDAAGMFGMSSFLAIDELQPGDALTVRFAFSVGTQDGSVPVFPAEALVAALERGLLPNLLSSADFDGDGDVDGEDFLVWQSNFGTASGAVRATGDADGDGDVDGEDFLAWQTEFGGDADPGSRSSVAIPEPVGGFLAAVGVCGAFARRHRAPCDTPQPHAPQPQAPQPQANGLRGAAPQQDSANQSPAYQRSHHGAALG